MPNMRAAIVEDGLVVAVCIVDHEDPAWEICPDYVNAGFTYDGETWTAPPPDPPVGDGSPEMSA